MSSKDFGYPYSHVVGDTQVKPGKGILRRITVNGLTTAGDATIYDSLTEGGNVVGILHLDPTTSVSVQPVTFEYDAKLATGLYIGFDATLVADLTVMYE